MAVDRWSRFQANAEALAKQAGAARASAAGAHGKDRVEAVTVGLNGDGRVEAVEFAADWRKRLGAGTAADAVREAIQSATTARLEAWARAVGDPDSATGDDAGPDIAASTDFARRFQEAATAAPTDETGRAVLSELLALLRQVEQGLDEVSAQLDTTLSRILLGRSRDGQVKVSVSGGGEVREIRYERQWLRHAHAVDIGRQTMAALLDAYAQVDRDGVTQLIARSPLGAAQRAVQDPFGLARRMRLTD